ncbi:MAG: transporter substrate-binding domain-containing protein, partial [Kiritimatiellaceae bacterium]|nr:transporter substrate-binding domain-containing protein [Kiritimatiellaceae bacterium]
MNTSLRRYPFRIVLMTCFCAGLIFAEKPAIRSFAETNRPPLSLLDANGKPDGFSIQLLREVLNKTQGDVLFINKSTTNPCQGLLNGTIDVIPIVDRISKNDPLFDFSTPYLTLHWAAFVKRSSPIQRESDLKTHRVAIVNDDPVGELAQREQITGSVVVLSCYEDAFTQLKTGEIDAVLAPKLIGLNLLSMLETNTVRTIGILPKYKQRFSFAVKKGNSGLLARLNEGLTLTYLDGTYDELYSEWIRNELRRELRLRKLRIGGDSNFPPYEFVNEQGVQAGFNVDLTRAIGRVMGLDIQIMLEPSSNLRHRLETGDIDAIQCMPFTQGASKVYDFSTHHQEISYVAFQPSNTNALLDISRLKKLRGAVVQGGLMHDYVRANELDSFITTVSTEEDAFNLLQKNSIDFMLGSYLSGIYWMEKNKYTELQKSTAQRVLTAPYGYACLRGNQELIQCLNEGLALLKSNGEYQRIWDRWLKITPDAPPVSQAPKSTRIILILLALILSTTVLAAILLHRRLVQTAFALKEQEQKYSRLFDNMPEGMALYEVIYDTEGNPINYCYLEVNNAFTILYGLKADELIGRTILDVEPQIKLDWNLCQKVVKTGRSRLSKLHFEALQKHLNVKLFSPRQGQLAAVFEDITERTKMENEIAQLARFPAENPNPVLRISSEGDLLYANNASRLILKYLRQFNGKIMSENFSVSFSELMTSNKIHQQEMICGDVTFMLTLSPQPAENEINLYASDITQRRRAEDRDKKSLSLLEATIESTADGILVADSQGKILCFNQKFIQMWRIPAELMTSGIDKAAQDIIFGQLCDPEQFSAKIKELYLRPKETSFDVLTFRDGRAFERYSQPQWVKGKAVGRVWSFRDITERKETMQKLADTLENLRASNRDLEQFAYVASHDLQEPLRMVANYLQLIERRYKDKLDQDGLEFINYAVDGAVRMQQLIDSLLDYSRLQTRTQPFETFPLEPVIERVLKNFEDRIYETEAKLVVDS